MTQGSRIRMRLMRASEQIAEIVRSGAEKQGEETIKSQKQDRRSQRTRRLITSATLELLFERRYDAITVKDILERADIGRSTFYAHFFDKEDVLTSIVDQMLESLHQQLAQRARGHRIVPALELFEHVQQNYLYFRAMMRGRTGEVLWDAAQAALSRSIEQLLPPHEIPDAAAAIPPEVMSRYLAGAFLSLLKWWLQAEMPYPPATMENIFQRLAFPGVQAALGGAITA